MRGRRRRAGGFTRFLKVLAISIILGVVGWHPVEKVKVLRCTNG
jgi:hypothetical protein